MYYCSIFSDFCTDSSVAINDHEAQMDDQTKQLVDIHEAPNTTLNNDSTQLEETKHLIPRNEEDDTKKKRNDVRFCLNFLKKNKNTNSKKFHIKKPSELPDSSAPKLTCSSKKIYAKNSRNLFRRMITCGMVDAKDSAIKNMRKVSQ